MRCDTRCDITLTLAPTNSSFEQLYTTGALLLLSMSDWSPRKTQELSRLSIAAINLFARAYAVAWELTDTMSPCEPGGQFRWAPVSRSLGMCEWLTGVVIPAPVWIYRSVCQRSQRRPASITPFSLCDQTDIDICVEPSSIRTGNPGIQPMLG